MYSFQGDESADAAHYGNHSVLSTRPQSYVNQVDDDRGYIRDLLEPYRYRFDEAMSADPQSGALMIAYKE